MMGTRVLRSTSVIFLSWVLSLTTTYDAHPQDKAVKAQDRSFLSLRDDRDELEKDIRDIEKNLAAYDTQQYWLKKEDRLKGELKAAQADKKTAPAKIAQLERDIAEART